MAEITAVLDLASWPKGTQVLVRREEPPPGASYALFDPHGLRYQALITNSKDSDIAHLEARHGLHAGVEHRIKETKECGLSNLPCARFQANLAPRLVHRYHDRPTVINELIFSATDQGPFMGIPATNRAMEVAASVIYEVPAGRLTGEAAYWGVATMLVQTGVMPAPGTPKAEA